MGRLEGFLRNVSHIQNQDNSNLLTEIFLVMPFVNFRMACRTRLRGWAGSDGFHERSSTVSEPTGLHTELSRTIALSL
jgi:hypothetical protein